MKVFSVLHNESKNASLKAPNDIDNILIDVYRAETKSISRKGIFKLKVLLYFLKQMFSKDIIVLQYPIIFKSVFYKLLPKKKTILLIHDIIGLRCMDNETIVKELSIFKQFKYIIVHNEKMKEYMISNGIDKDSIYVLEIFDYLTNNKNILEKNFDIRNFKIIYPGNLKIEKSPFLYQLDENKLKYSINLYGLGIKENINDKLIYKGSFEAENIDDLEGNIGLIWDGNYDESDEKESYKNYTKYNNPHKLSCCLAMGIPVIVWRKSAIADFVLKNNIGYTISNIYDINNIDFSDYEIKMKNAIEIGKKLRNGFYTKRIFKKIIEKINFEEK